MTAAPEIIEFTATTTLADVLAVNLVKPVAKGFLGRTWMRPVLLLGLMLLGVFGGILFSSGDKIAAFKEVLTTRLGLEMGVIMVTIGAWIWIFGRIWRWFVRTMTRRIYVDARRGHPDVDHSTKALTLQRLYRFDDTGLTTSSSIDEIWEGWPRINGLDETRDLFVLRVGQGGAAYPIPKAQLSAELRERLPLFVAARCNSKWPF